MIITVFERKCSIMYEANELEMNGNVHHVEARAISIVIMATKFTWRADEFSK